MTATTRAAFASNPRAIHDWLREGNTGTARYIAEVLGINFNSVKVAVKRLRRDGYVEVLELVRVKGAKTPACVYAAKRDDLWVQRQVARPAPGIVGRAMNRRTPIEMVWQGLAA